MFNINKMNLVHIIFMDEIFVLIDGYPNYEVSNLGRVKSLNYRRTGKEKILNYIVHKNGYLCVNLCKNGKRKMFRVHQLVARAFIPNPENKEYIDHRNTIKTDNRVENLRWCTIKENNNNELTRKNNSLSKKGKTPWNKGKKCKLENGKRVWY